MEFSRAEVNRAMAEMEDGLRRDAEERPHWPHDPVRAAELVQEAARDLVAAGDMFLYGDGDSLYGGLRAAAVKTAALAFRFLVHAGPSMAAKVPPMVEKVPWWDDMDRAARLVEEFVDEVRANHPDVFVANEERLIGAVGAVRNGWTDDAGKRRGKILGPMLATAGTRKLREIRRRVEGILDGVTEG